MRVKLIFLSMLLLLLTIPNLAIAVGPGMHFFDCKECHLSGLNLAALGDGNVCLKCHDTKAGGTTFLNEGNPHGVAYNIAIKGNAKFSGGDASARYGNNPTPVDQISHNWATSPTNPEAGATNPSLALHPTMSGNRGRNTASLNCSRCHNTHGAFDLVVNPSLLVNSDDRTEIMATDDLCTACHTGFSGSLANPGNDALVTHPLLNATQLAVAEADVDNATKFFPMVGALPVYSHTDPFANDVQLVDNAAGNAGLSCMTCHGLHFTDSNSSTPDGPAVAEEPLFTGGDGLLLRSDGPTRLDAVSYNGVTNRYNTAQLRSNLCQTCHTYKMHGNPAYNSSPGSENPNHNIGCLDCHGGHSYNGGTPSLYVLSDESPDAVPTRLQKTYNGDVQVNYPVVNSATTRTEWADNVVGTATGFCEVCHGDVNDPAAGGLANAVDQHKTSGSDECSNCHTHGDPGYSFKLDASAASCGDCHGFPPYLNTRGDRAAWYDARDGGYAYYNASVTNFPTGYSYNSPNLHFKDESTTAHKTHAGRDLKSGANTAVLGAEGWYFVGSAGIDNCTPCHGPDSGKTEGGHKVDPTTDPNTFRNVPFDVIATGQGNLSPNYNTSTNSCDNVYCHTAGAPRDGGDPPGTPRLWSLGAGAANTPTWDLASGDGFNSILGSGTRCATCHGNTISTMAGKGNTSAHAVHINSATLNYACGVCHENTAIDNTTLSLNATDHRPASGGLHVNGVQDVVFNSTVLYNALAIDKNSYNSTTGTCSVYCHDPGNTGQSADWDNGALACNSCHENTALTTGSHAIHVDPTLADISCDSCHGAGASLGTHTNHVDGTPDVTDGVCDSCHGVENTDIWDVTPTWGDPDGADCRTCHTGATTSYNSVSLANIVAPDKTTALTVGHNVPTGNPNYLSTDNLAANKTCEDCHLSLTTGHVDGLGNGDRLVGGFDCNDCHTAGGSRNLEATVRVMTHDNTDLGYTLKKQADFGKACFACHDPHGSSNIAMIHDSQTKQNSVDPDSPAKDFSGDVVFADFNSFDPVAGSNLQAICATCHTATAHNSQAGSPPDPAHNEGIDCQSCHDHNQAVGGFMPTGGTACNDCHGNPPLIVADMPHGGNPGAHAVHVIIGSDVPPEDTSDCGVCHLGAESYTLAPGGTHMDGSTDGGLMAGITNDNCTSACHNSTPGGDGSWSDADGLSCNACHGNAPTDNQHNAHTVTAGKACADCHQASDPQAPGPLPHIDDKTGALHVDIITGMADAQPDEANVNFSDGSTSYTFDAGLNTCSAGTNNGLGCHASGSADWDDSATGDNCADCHTNTTNTFNNPTSGLHNVTPFVSEVRHDVTLSCEACHGDPTLLGTHADGSFTGGNNQLVQMGLDGGFYTQTADNEGTCANTSCHVPNSDDWEHVWTNTANYYEDKDLSCNGCHGMTNSGFNTGTTHKNTSGMRAKHGVQTTDYFCKDCHNIEGSGYTFTFNTADWNPAPGDTSTHGDGDIQINSQTSYVDGTGYCTACHTSGAYNFTDTGWNVVQPIGDAIVTSCGECHLGGASAAGATESHTKHGIDFATDLVDNGPNCTPCHAAPAGGFLNTLADTHGDGNVTLDNSRITAYAGGLVKWDGSESTCTNACHLTDGGEVWDVTNTLACDSCHYYEGTPNSANNTGGTVITGAHDAHFDAAIITTCNQCHPDNAADTNAPFTHTIGTTILERSSQGLVADNADMTPLGGNFNDGTDTCNNAACHNPTPAASFVSPNWNGGPVSDCTMCHADSAPGPVSGSHAGHFNTIFGRTIDCNDCHTDNSGSFAHQNATVDVQILDENLAGPSVVATPTAANACGTNECHQNGSKAAPDSGSYTWGTPIAGTCTACHGVTGAALDAVDGAHTTHLSGTEGPTIGTACGDCHDAVSSSDMTGKIAHINNIPTFSDSAAKAATTACNNCHGNSSTGNAALITTAKANWNGSTSVTCESCHGAGDPATENADGSGVVAPNRGGANFTAVGHGGTPSQVCADCHSTASAHISGTLDDANRLLTQGASNFDFEVGGQENAYCNECHLTTMNAHFDDSNSTGGTSDPGLFCYVCHEPHGQSGYSLMIRDTIQGRAVSNFTLPKDATDYFDSKPGATNGVCQVCHDANDSALSHYTRTTADGHNDTAVCTSCHTHDAAPAFNKDDAGGGCNGCHGDANGSFWPKDRSGTGEDTLANTGSQGGGKHQEHMLAIASVKYPNDALVDDVTTINNLLTDNGYGTAWDKQLAVCEYCHAAGTEAVDGRDSNHGNIDSTDVFVDNDATRHANNLWGVADLNATYNPGTGTCSTVDCHFNNAITPHWYNDNTPPADQSLLSLNAETGTEPNSIRVYWNAPGDDGLVANTTAYVYEMRYGKTPGEALTYTVGAGNYVGGLPATYKQGEPAEVIVENLDPSTTYYFSMRTRDTAGNWSDIPVSTVTAVSNDDTQAPDFGGINKASTADVSSAINLVWTAAEDHTMPMTYNIWQKVYDPQDLLDMDADLPTVTGWKDHHYQATGLSDDTVYTFGVRACDANGLCETNTQTSSAVAKLPLTVPKVPANYISQGTTTLVLDGTPGGGASDQALPLVFAPSANVAATTDYFVDSFNVELYSANGGTVTLEVGTSTDGTNGTFTAFTPAATYSKSVTLSRKARRLVNFKIADSTGKQVTKSLARISIRLTNTSGTTVASYGSSTTGGILSLTERLLNVPPSNPSLNAVVNGAKIDMTWTQVTDTVDGVNDDADLHYDIFGSIDNGATWDYLIVDDLPVTDVAYSWNTQDSGVPASSQVAVQLRAGDGFDHYTGAGSMVSGLSIDNSADLVAPNAPIELVAEKRPKSGTVWLTWSAPGDDEDNHGRAERYDIVYAPAATTITEGNFYDSPTTTTEVYGEPTPDFGGTLQSYEVTGLQPEVEYNFAIKAVDEAGNVSPISVAKTAGSDSQFGGPRCGMCHTTGPSVVNSEGNHKLHGFTLNQCDKCHTPAADSGGDLTAPSAYKLDHQDGVLKMGYGPNGAYDGEISGSTITYYSQASHTGSVLYQDTDGFGGFGDGSYTDVGPDNTDSGSCINFGSLGVGGCHGPAGTDPDDGGPLPTYLPAPTWDAAATLDCSLCHGNPDRFKDPYGRDYDAALAAAEERGGPGTTPLVTDLPDQILGAPAVDNHGNFDPAAATPAERKYIGQHEKHLNYSFRFSKSDSCALCHKGDYAERLNLDSRHGNGEIDVQLDIVAAGPDAEWLPGDAVTAGTCATMSPDSCHPNDQSPAWDSGTTFDCVGCHSMGGSTPGHTTDPNKLITNDEPGGDTGVPGYVPGAKVVPGNCMYCHFGGHPTDTVGGEALILENNPQVGLDYRSGGVHLRASIGGRPAVSTEAELCWSCHQDNNISEWNADDGTYNTETAPTKAGTNLDYNYGSVSGGTYTSSWVSTTPGVGAWWTSGTPAFSYKSEAIQSTHSTSVSGSSALDVPGKDYNSAGLGNTETPDPVDIIRCSNCHDVHDLNKATADNSSGAPYLRGTWKRNPYKEDGAPQSGTTYTGQTTAGGFNYGAVPRGGPLYSEVGGYQIDQNNGNPTSGWSVSTSAGLCILCHNPASGVDGMDKELGENLWLGTNGHSNSSIGGSTGNAANIFTTDIRNPNGAPSAWAGLGHGSGVPVMGYEQQIPSLSYGEGIRGIPGNRADRGWSIGPLVTDEKHYQAFDWGVSQENAGAVDAGYHAFSCSKCHNPHASRLPKLMITNCLDTSHNEWDDTFVTPGAGVANGAGSVATLSADNTNQPLSNVTSAQNCHRYGDPATGGTGDGWNKVTPW